MSHIRDLNRKTMTDLFDEAATITGVQKPDSYNPIITAVQSGRYKLMDVQDFRRAFTAYADGRLSFTRKEFKMSLKFIGDVLAAYVRLKRPVSEAATTSNALVVGEDSTYWNAMKRILNRWGEIPVMMFWQKCYDYGVKSGEVEPMKHNQYRETARSHIMSTMSAREQRRAPEPTEADLTSESYRIHMERWCMDYLREKGVEPKIPLRSFEKRVQSTRVS